MVVRVVESRLWRPAAQRSVRNAWSYIQGHRSSWSFASETNLSAATALVNAYLRHGDVEAMDYGVLTDVERLKDNTRRKLLLDQKTHLLAYLSTYEDMAQSALQIASAAASMKTYVNNSGSGLITFTNIEASVDGDSGDGGGVPVFGMLPLSAHELLASEIVSMYKMELKVKWLLASEFCKLVYPDSAEAISLQRQLSSPDWAEAGASTTTPSSEGTSKNEAEEAPKNFKAEPPKRETLQVYLTALLAEVYIHRDRVEEISKICNEEMSVGLFSSP